MQSRIKQIKSYARTLLFLSIIIGFNLLLSPIIGYRAVGFIFLISILGVGSVTSIGPVLFAAFLSTLAWNFLFIPPRFALEIAHTDDLILCFTYFVAALITGVLTTQIRRNQEILRERDERLKQAEILKESEKLHQTILNSISHELRTPLTTIVGLATALSDENSPDTRDFRHAIALELTLASDRLNRVIENLLDMSRLNSGVMQLKKEWHDTHDLIGVMLRRLDRNLEGHLIQIDVPPDLPLIEIDFRLLEHALSNILLNATQHSPPKTEIKISVRAIYNSVTILIEDSGPGISPEYLDKIFDKFYRVPGTSAGGTGLGLSIAKNIIDLHRGEIRAENREGGGLRFIIVLPLGNAPEAPKEKDETNLSH